MCVYGGGAQETVYSVLTAASDYKTLLVQVRSQSLSEEQSCFCSPPACQAGSKAALAAPHSLGSVAMTVSSVAMNPIFFYSPVSSLMVPMCSAPTLDSLQAAVFQTLGTLF